MKSISGILIRFIVSILLTAHPVFGGVLEVLNYSNGLSKRIVRPDLEAEGLIVQEIGIKATVQNQLREDIDTTTIDEKDIVPRITKQALCYPNPFRLEDGGHIGYRLSKDMDIQIRLYDMGGNEVWRKECPKGQQGGYGQLTGYNKVPITTSDLGGSLPVGPYLFVILHNGEVLGKEKLVIRP